MMVRLRVPLVARPIDEDDRASSPLELLFDLTFVVAISQAVAQLALHIEEGDVAVALAPFALTFFGIWWAWMNFTWFSSGYDNDDALYRVTTMVQMMGVLVLASGVPAAFEENNYWALTIGYFVMRVGLIAQWIRAAASDPQHRGNSVRTIIGYSVLQAAWFARLFLTYPWSVLAVVLLVAFELLVPLWAARAADPGWNPRHIAERFGLFTIILLGESVLAAMTGFQRSVTENGLSLQLTTVALSAVVILFALWWLYYLQPAAQGLAQRREVSYLWAYGHFFVFITLAGLGAGLEVVVAASPEHSDIAPWVVASLVTLPVAGFLLTFWFVHAHLIPSAALRARVVLPAALLVAVLPLAANSLPSVEVVVIVATTCALAVVLATFDQERRSPNFVSRAPYQG
jgi:low temperature requirement protein LtrA